MSWIAVCAIGPQPEEKQENIQKNQPGFYVLIYFSVIIFFSNSL